MIAVTIVGVTQEARSGERLIDVINRAASTLLRFVITHSLVLSRPATPVW
jgi:hypothetical protein